MSVPAIPRSLRILNASVDVILALVISFNLFVLWKDRALPKTAIFFLGFNIATLVWRRFLKSGYAQQDKLYKIIEEQNSIIGQLFRHTSDIVKLGPTEREGPHRN